MHLPFFINIHLHANVRGFYRNNVNYLNNSVDCREFIRRMQETIYGEDSDDLDKKRYKINGRKRRIVK